MLFLMTGCSSSTSTQEKLNSVPEATAETDSQSNLKSDADLTKQLEAEKGIEKVMVQVVEGEQRAVNVDLEINDEQELSADEVINKYSALIKEKYPDRTIDIIVAKDGKLLKQVTLE